MKKFIATALFVSLLATAAVAGPGTSNSTKVNSLFETEYPGAEHISYTTKQDFTTVKFTWNQQRMQAFYDKEGNKIGTSRIITLNNLPLRAQKIISQRYSNYIATEAIEFDNAQEGSAYFISLQNQDTQKKLILQVTSQGEVSLFKKIK